MLIERYLPGNFLAIRIQCFRCGAVSSTPGLPDGEILPRAAVPVVATQTPAVTTTDIARGTVLACQEAATRDYALTRPRVAAGRAAAAVARACWRPPPRTMTG